VLLGIDVGNTQTLIGLFDGANLVHHWRTRTDAERTVDEHALLLSHFLDLVDLDVMTDVTGMAVSSVVPRVTASLRGLSDRWIKVPIIVIEPGTKTGLPILTENPKDVGADGVANAVAAYDLYGGPTVVVDFGTATRFDIVSAKGEYLGSTIIPGIEISLDALFGRAAALRRVELVEPRSVIGKSTVEAIQAGAVYGFTDQVDGLVHRFEKELGECTVISTGDVAELIAPLSTTIQHHEPWLTLYGLRLVYERNMS
jgi:type III pantothenate kinase